MADNPHKGHRERLKTRAAEYGFASLAPHEQLELLLCYTIPQGNTNPTAHRLLDRFGSLPAVCAAPTEELLTVAGVGPHTVSFLRLLPALVRAYLEAEAEPVECYDTADKLEALLIRRYVGITEEKITLLLLGPKADLISVETMEGGSINAVSTTVRSILKYAIRADAAFVAIAHNHPGGIAIPSCDDLTATRQIAAALDLAGVPLLEHFVVAGDHALPILMGENLRGRNVCQLDVRRFYAPHTEVSPCN